MEPEGFATLTSGLGTAGWVTHKTTRIRRGTHSLNLLRSHLVPLRPVFEGHPVDVLVVTP